MATCRIRGGRDDSATCFVNRRSTIRIRGCAGCEVLLSSDSAVDERKARRILEIDALFFKYQGPVLRKRVDRADVLSDNSKAN